LTDPNHVEAIDIAFSGGGFRAALFHLGVIGFLRERRNLLARVRTICSVSGGSILAAHLVAHWDRYTAPEESSFKERASDLARKIMSSDLSGGAMTASAWRLMRLRTLSSEYLVEAYEQFLGLADGYRRWDDLPRDGDRKVPRLCVLATHLNTGRACAYAAEGFQILPGVPASVLHSKALDALSALAANAKMTHQSLARAVAASSAFPPVFAPVPLDPSEPLQLLTDGGVYDNSGVNYLRSLYERRALVPNGRELVLVCDAGRSLSPTLGQTYDTFLELAVRVTDTQGSRIAETDSASARRYFEANGVRYVSASLSDRIVPFPGLPVEHSIMAQELLASVRTELDPFTATEVMCLYRHGYWVAQQALLPHVKGEKTDAAWVPVDRDKVATELGARVGAKSATVTKDALEEHLRDSHINRKSRRLRRWLASLGAALALVVAIAGAATGFLMAKACAVPRLAVPTGVLPIREVALYDTASWAAKLPIVAAAIDASAGLPFVYLVTTATVGEINGGRGAAHTSMQIESGLKGAALYVFIEEQSEGVARFQAAQQTEEGRARYFIPATSASTRVRVVIVSHEKIDPLFSGVQAALSLKVQPL
jgi:predicted acylesterase/phospholipase RssA